MTFKLDAVGRSFAPVTYSYEWKDAVLYALGIGATVDELDYLYEGRGPRVYPSFAVIPTMRAVFEALAVLEGPMEKVVHGAQKVVMHAPLPPSATLETTATLENLLDLKRLSQATVRTSTVDKDKGTLLFETSWQIVYLGEGGYGNAGTRVRDERVLVPEREPDFRVQERTAPEQALLYRLSGDGNPLHADPAFPLVARFGGKPILHGLCSFGYATRAIVRAACGGDGDRVRSLTARFTMPVWPGETLITEGWIEGSRAIARTLVREREGEVVLSGMVAVLAGP